MIEASDDATWDKKKDGMALNDAMYMCNVVARRAVWQQTPSEKSFCLFHEPSFFSPPTEKKSSTWGS